ncbi:ATP synthase Fo complex subunit b [Gammaproteobacteria bacterium]
MNFTATLFAQILTFGILVWFVQRFLWGPLTALLEERKQKIAEGLAMAERGRHEKELAEFRARDLLRDAKDAAAEIIESAQRRAGEIVDEAKSTARVEGDRILSSARSDAESEFLQARERLRAQVGSLAVMAAERILQKEIDSAAHREILDGFSRQL